MLLSTWSWRCKTTRQISSCATSCASPVGIWWTTSNTPRSLQPGAGIDGSTQSKHPHALPAFAISFSTHRNQTQQRVFLPFRAQPGTPKPAVPTVLPPWESRLNTYTHKLKALVLQTPKNGNNARRRSLCKNASQRSQLRSMRSGQRNENPQSRLLGKHTPQNTICRQKQSAPVHKYEKKSPAENKHKTQTQQRKNDEPDLHEQIHTKNIEFRRLIAPTHPPLPCHHHTPRRRDPASPSTAPGPERLPRSPAAAPTPRPR